MDLANHRTGNYVLLLILMIGLASVLYTFSEVSTPIAPIQKITGATFVEIEDCNITNHTKLSKFIIVFNDTSVTNEFQRMVVTTTGNFSIESCPYVGNNNQQFIQTEIVEANQLRL